VNALYHQTKGRVRLVGLSLGEENLQQYIRQHGIEFPVVTRLPSDVVIDYRLGGTPQTIVVDAEGRVIKTWMGAYQRTTRQEIETQLNVDLPELMAATAPTTAGGGAR
jgi:hypothetical protein